MTDPTLIKPSLYIWNSRVLFIGPATDAVEHRHHVLQIAVGIDGPVRLHGPDAICEARIVLIAPDQPHRFAATPGWQILLYIDCETMVGQFLVSRFLRQSAVAELDFPPVEPLIGQWRTLCMPTGSCDLAGPFYEGIVSAFAGSADTRSPMSSSVQRALVLLRQLPLKKVSVKSVAARVELSESRLIHLFSGQVGVSFRSYLLWLRMIEAVHMARQGASLTEAAHEVGFADSAHLSRTFKRTIGMTPRFVLKNSRYIQVFSCGT